MRLTGPLVTHSGLERVKRLQMILALTDNLLEDYLRCESKSYLRLQGRHGQTTDYSALCAQLDARHRASALQLLVAESTTVGVRRLGGSRLEELATGHAMILDAVAGADGLETHFDGLQRVPGGSRLGPYSYRPIRFLQECATRFHRPSAPGVRCTYPWSLAGYMPRRWHSHLWSRVQANPRTASHTSRFLDYRSDASATPDRPHE